jgi:uncharacterized protein YlxP (DUF503 family)
MIVAACTLKLQLHGPRSLKEKRRIVKSLTRRLGQEFNVAVAEVDHHEVWQTAALAVVSVGTDAGTLHSRMERVVEWIRHTRPDLYIEDVRFELR